MVKEGKVALTTFCESSGYEYDEALVDRILENELRFQLELNIESKNVFRYPILRSILVKLAVAWFTLCMVFYGIMLGTIPGGVLVNNLCLGVLSSLSGPLVCFLFKSRYANRRLSLSAIYFVAGVMVILMAFTTKYKDSIAALTFGAVTFGLAAGAFRTGCR